MAKSKRWIRLAAAAAVALASETTLAQAASTDPQVVADNTETARVIAQTALINAKNTNIAGKYGAAATAPQGAISGVDKFLAMGPWAHAKAIRAEEHTSELQSLMRNSYAVFCLKKTPHRS